MRKIDGRRAGTRQEGPHGVLRQSHARIGQRLDGEPLDWFPTLTQARKAAKRGDAIVCGGFVVATK